MKLLLGDSKEKLKEIEDNSVDFICTDPPYHLSNDKTFEDRVKESFRSFNDIVFPDFKEFNIQISKYSDLVRILSERPDLCWKKFSSIGIKPGVSMPESSIHFNGTIIERQIEINTSGESTSLGISNSELVDKVNIEKSQFVGDYILDFGDTFDFFSSNISGSNFGQFLDGCFTMPIISIETPGIPGAQSSLSLFSESSNFFDNIRFSNNSFSNAQSSSFILAHWRTKEKLMLRLDIGGGAGKLFTTNSTSQSDLFIQCLSPKLVRTLVGTSCLSSIFKPITISFIVNTTNGANHCYFHLWLPPKFSISNIYKKVKGFMNKEWDVLPSPEIFKECFRVLKPGAFINVMSAPRTDVYWRMCQMIEEAGFEVDFTPIMWAYASGFPKAMNIGKAVDKRGGQDLTWFIDYIIKYASEHNISKKELVNLFPSKNGNPTGWLWNKQHTQGITLDQYNKIKDFLKLKFDTIEECEREIIGTKKAGLGSGESYAFTENNQTKGVVDITKPASDKAKALDGSFAGYQPKPAVEMVIVAMKPLSEKTYVDQALKNGKGISWFDDCRIPYESEDKPIAGNRTSNFSDIENEKISGGNGSGGFEANAQGRFPANLLVSDNAVDTGREHKGQQGATKGNEPSTQVKANTYGDYSGYGKPTEPRGDTGDFSRYFSLDKWFETQFAIFPKASKSEKNEGLKSKGTGSNSLNKKCIKCGKWSRQQGIDKEKYTCVCDKPEWEQPTGNIHPTIKPLKLMSYLITLFSQKGDVILDPFMGSGTTGVACKKLERDFIGIELMPEYMEICKTRINNYESEFIVEIEDKTETNKEPKKKVLKQDTFF